MYECKDRIEASWVAVLADVSALGNSSSSDG